MKIFKVFVSWLLFIAICLGLYYGLIHFKQGLFWVNNWWQGLPTASPYQAVLFGLSMAFFWVEVKKWGIVKPFTCMKCMAGWLTFLFAVTFHVPFAVCYLFVGLFIGSMFEAIKMRYL